LTQADRTNLLTGARWCAAMADYLPGRADAEKEDFRCGQALAALGYHEAAIRRFDMYISYAGEHPVDQNTAVIRADSYNLRGASLMELGDLKGALDSVNQAVKAFPDAPFFRYVRAAVELRLNDSKAAIQDLDVAVTKGQEQQDPVTLRAYALLEGVKAKMKSEK
ncbi:MAG TPA: tetratricopeptide repeat protein, partial [Fimbriimonadaceae bacterium]|nr:tetratricopeptide repeat protein [Fimbriimonadaceae bacterium]